MPDGSFHHDEPFMREALAEARKALGRTSPNPVVGCVLVKDGRVIARGHHRQAGQPHAEVDAIENLRRAAGDPRGATLYVNLEPCDHQGRTGPCTRAIVDAGITTVVIGMMDPNPLVNGRGAARLREAGIEVRLGALEAECRRVNEAFTRWITAGRPHVTLKAAVSLDGRIAGPGGLRQWITGEESRAEVHRMRDVVDAVLVGAGTVLADDPLLTTRLPDGVGKTGMRVVLDTTLRIPPTARVLSTVEGAPPTRVFTTTGPGEKATAFGARGARIVTVPGGPDGGVDLHATLGVLAKEGVTSLLVEGGATVYTRMLRARLVDRIAIFVAPRLLGADAPAVVDALAPGVRLADVAVRRLGDDVLIEGVPEWIEEGVPEWIEEDVPEWTDSAGRPGEGEA